MSDKKKIVHVVGNGDQAQLFNRVDRGKNKVITCNMPPFEIPNVAATCMVDFKMMAALTEGHVKLDAYDWVLGTRPRIWMDQRPAFYMKYAPNVKGFYTHVPEYAGNATNFNCGHMAVHYTATKYQPDEIHMYGFDTMFDFNIRSVTDLYLNSDRDASNNFRLINNWRPIWTEIFKEFPDIQFVLHHTHSDLKIKAGSNVTVAVHEPTRTVKGNSSNESLEDTLAALSGQQPPSMNRHQRRAQEAIRRKGK